MYKTNIKLVYKKKKSYWSSVIETLSTESKV